MIRIGEQVARGYLEKEMIETSRRYIPKSEVEAVKAGIDREWVKPRHGGGTGRGAGATRFEAPRSRRSVFRTCFSLSGCGTVPAAVR